MSGERISAEDWHEAVCNQEYQELEQEFLKSSQRALDAMTEAQRKQDEETDWFEILPLFLGAMAFMGAALGAFAALAHLFWRLWPA